VIIAIILIGVAGLINLVKKDVWDINSKLLKKEVLSIGQSVENVSLLDVTPFEWDIAYSFDPYTPIESIYETVGYKWDNISETVSEGMNQIVFLKDGKVVCYLYGYPENNGYGINFSSENKLGGASASVLTIKDDLTFQVIRIDNVIYLSTAQQKTNDFGIHQ